MRRSLPFRILKTGAAALTVLLLCITIASIWVSAIVWLPSARFVGVQNGRFGWGDHGSAHGEYSVHINSVSADLDWTGQTRKSVPVLSGIPIVAPLFKQSSTTWLPLWIALAPAAAMWLTCVLLQGRRRPGSCAGCGYDLRGVPEQNGARVCPECGNKSGVPDEPGA